METSIISDPIALRKINDCGKRGIKLTVAKSRIRLHSPTRRTVLHSDHLEDVPEIDTFVSEEFRKFLLIALQSEQEVPVGIDYSEARWAKDGHEFSSHGECFIRQGRFRYSVSLRTSLIWTEDWNWEVWPDLANIRSRYDKLINNYRATMRVLAFASERKLDPHFYPETRALQFGDVKVVASNGSWELGFDVQDSQQLSGAIPTMKYLSEFLDGAVEEDLVEEPAPAAPGHRVGLME
jgi:hypothetical protein